MVPHVQSPQNKTGTPTSKPMVRENNITLSNSTPPLSKINTKAQIRCQSELETIRTHWVQEVINQVSRKTRTDRSEFDSDNNTLNVKNGLLNLQTLKLKPHSPEYLSMIQIPTIYDAEANCPEISKFLETMLRSEDIQVMLQAIGYSLYGSCEFDKCFMLFGNGANDKGVMIKVIEALMGQANCSHRSLQVLDTNRFAVADLHNKLVNTYADLTSLRLSETGNFKMIVSGDSITGGINSKMHSVLEIKLHYGSRQMRSQKATIKV